MRRAATAALLVAGAAIVAVPAAVLSMRSGAEAPTVTRDASADADALLRRARVESDASHAIEAERLVREALDRDPGDYNAMRMLAAVLLAQHRFADAIPVAERARAVRPDDAWNDGTLGDAWLELGDYDKAFAAFERMVRRRPNAASYARVSYARELQGDLAGAVEAMRLSSEAAPVSDPEARAWHAAQLGNLLLRMGRHDDAEREYRRAEHYLPKHPYARAGMVRLLAARGRLEDALAIVEDDLARAPTPELEAWAGDLLARLGRHARARAHYERMEALEREGWASEEPQPGALGRMLAERSLEPMEALALAERAALTRRDIHTMDAVAWAAFKAGRLDRAVAASKEAMRTGTRDQRILAHAAAIAAATGDRASARSLAARAVEGGPFDLIAFDEASRVLDIQPRGRGVEPSGG